LNETDPLDTLQLAVLIIRSLAETGVSNADKIAALRVAASAVEQANLAQLSATALANVVKGTVPK
jgi:hypothetical protein